MLLLSFFVCVSHIYTYVMVHMYPYILCIVHLYRPMNRQKQGQTKGNTRIDHLHIFKCACAHSQKNVCLHVYPCYVGHIIHCVCKYIHTYTTYISKYMRSCEYLYTCNNAFDTYIHVHVNICAFLCLSVFKCM
jgi:hypothetical protein